MPARFQLVIDCTDSDLLARFWAAALGYVLEPPQVTPSATVRMNLLLTRRFNLTVGPICPVSLSTGIPCWAAAVWIAATVSRMAGLIIHPALMVRTLVVTT